MSALKRILLPTDFSIESLHVLKHAARNTTADELHVIMLYCCHLPESIGRLLFYSPNSHLQGLISKDFSEACSVLQNKYSSRIRHINYQTFHGKNQAAFRNFLEGQRIDEVYIPQQYAFKLNGNGFDPLPFIKRTTLPVHVVDWKRNGNGAAKDSLAELFED